MKDRGECFECGSPAQCDHHVIPKSLGGTKTIPLCLSCHGKIHGRDLVNQNKLMKKGSDNRAADGGFIGGPPPFGWESVIDPKNPKRKILVKDEVQQLLIGILVDMRSNNSRSYETISFQMERFHQVKKHASTWMRIYDREINAAINRNKREN